MKEVAQKWSRNCKNITEFAEYLATLEIVPRQDGCA
jgi:hypothetical protein